MDEKSHSSNLEDDSVAIHRTISILTGKFTSNHKIKCLLFYLFQLVDWRDVD